MRIQNTQNYGIGACWTLFDLFSSWVISRAVAGYMPRRLGRFESEILSSVNSLTSKSFNWKWTLSNNNFEIELFLLSYLFLPSNGVTEVPKIASF